MFCPCLESFSLSFHRKVEESICALETYAKYILLIHLNGERSIYGATSKKHGTGQSKWSGFESSLTSVFDDMQISQRSNLNDRKNIHSLKLTVRPWNEAIPKGNSSSNHPFSGAMLVSGRGSHSGFIASIKKHHFKTAHLERFHCFSPEVSNISLANGSPQSHLDNGPTSRIIIHIYIYIHVCVYLQTAQTKRYKCKVPTCRIGSRIFHPPWVVHLSGWCEPPPPCCDPLLVI